MTSEQYRFLSKVSPEPTSGCWLWDGWYYTRGYGGFHLNGHDVHAHRASYELFVGQVFDKYVLHKCDTPACVNPAHLFLGTQQDNMQDKKKRVDLQKKKSITNGLVEK